MVVGEFFSGYSCYGPMKSVPPRGSGWVFRFSISDCRLPIGFIGKRQSEIGN